MAPCDAQARIRELEAACDKLMADNAEYAKRHVEQLGRIERLTRALEQMKNFAAEVYVFIDADKELKAMKLACAMAGNKGYRHDVDEALAALAPPAQKEPK